MQNRNTPCMKWSWSKFPLIAFYSGKLAKKGGDHRGGGSPTPPVGKDSHGGPAEAGDRGRSLCQFPDKTH